MAIFLEEYIKKFSNKTWKVDVGTKNVSNYYESYLFVCTFIFSIFVSNLIHIIPDPLI